MFSVESFSRALDNVSPRKVEDVELACYSREIFKAIKFKPWV